MKCGEPDAHWTLAVEDAARCKTSTRMADLNPTSAVLQLSASESINELACLFDAAIAPIGMTASASGMVSGARALGPDAFHFMNWPAAWISLYQARDFAAIDLVPRWAMVSGEACSWTEVVRTYPKADPGRVVYAAANAHGFYEGFVTPVRTRSGELGLVSVGGGRRPAFKIQERIFLQVVSVATLLRAEALLQPAAVTASVFTRREQDCIALLRQGFTDSQIGRVLGIGPTTVRSHLENARGKVGARNRAELAARSSERHQAADGASEAGPPPS